MTQTAKHRALRIAVYVFLVASAAAAFLLGDWLRAAAREGDVPMWAPLVPPSIFTLFVVAYAVDRWLLLKRRRNTLGRSVIQIAFAIIFVSLLWLWPYQAPLPGDVAVPDIDLNYRTALLEHPEANVRAAACELIGLRGQTEATDRIDGLAAKDSSALVRQACGQAALRLRAVPATDRAPAVVGEPDGS